MVPVLIADREKSCSKFGAGDGLTRNWPQSDGELTKTKVHGLHLGQLGPQLLSFLRGTVLQLFIEQVFKPTILGSHLLGDT